MATLPSLAELDALIAAARAKLIAKGMTDAEIDRMVSESRQPDVSFSDLIRSIGPAKMLAPITSTSTVTLGAAGMWNVGNGYSNDHDVPPPPKPKRRGLRQCECRCGYRWRARSRRRPRVCPRCKSAWWDQPRRRSS